LKIIKPNGNLTLGNYIRDEYQCFFDKTS